MSSKPPFKKVLIANRGEIAVRILRACHELGIRTVSVYSKADADALHAKLAHESICIGPPAATDSYLNINALVSAAAVTGAEAIHPGYGFLSENSSFAEICDQCGITFIGPTVRNMQLMGDKEQARQIAMEHNVPTIPGTVNAGIDAEAMLLEAERIGFPVLIKARSGGGGRGMKIVESADNFIPTFEQAKREVEAAFNDPYLYLEKYVPRARHVEVQNGHLWVTIIMLGISKEILFILAKGIALFKDAIKS
jgi:acetyl-CoA carboxylase biotin carboxylase subunit